MEKKAVSLLEIVIALVILALSMLALCGIFIAGKRNIQNTRFKVAASEVAKQFLDERHMEVRQDTWGANCVSNNVGCPTSNATVDGFSYAPNFQIFSQGVDPFFRVRKVKLRVSWDEYNPAP